jgi:hypothetical protein
MILGCIDNPNKHPHKKQQENDQGKDRIDLYVFDGP